jgi:hypothetical protein
MLIDMANLIRDVFSTKSPLRKLLEKDGSACVCLHTKVAFIIYVFKKKHDNCLVIPTQLQHQSVCCFRGVKTGSVLVLVGSTKEHAGVP